jgi:hypothetical protein
VVRDIAGDAFAGGRASMFVGITAFNRQLVWLSLGCFASADFVDQIPMPVQHAGGVAAPRVVKGLDETHEKTSPVRRAAGDR